MNRDEARRIADRLPTRFLRSYALGKLRFDPVYEAVEQRLRGHKLPIFDLGCGVGLLAFYLRDRGLAVPLTGVDHDEKKVAVAQAIAGSDSTVQFRRGDARDAIPHGMSVTAIDVLHYFSDDEQRRILDAIAEAVPPDGVAIIRDAVRDGSLRYRMTAIQESFARAIRWLKADRLNFPLRDAIVAPFAQRGFSIEMTPLWGRTPFNNYLFVFRRPPSGMTNV